jgi:hypothetical protein
MGLDHHGLLKLHVANAAEDYGEGSLVHRVAARNLAEHEAKIALPKRPGSTTAAYFTELLRTAH